MTEGQQVLKPELGPRAGHPYPQRTAGFPRLGPYGGAVTVVGEDVAALLVRQPGQRGCHRVAGFPGEQDVVGPFRFGGVENARCRRRAPAGRLGVRADQVARGHHGVRQDGFGSQPLAGHQQPLQAVLHQVVDVSMIGRPGGDDTADDRLRRHDLMRRSHCRLVLHRLAVLSGLIAGRRGPPWWFRAARPYPAAGRLGPFAQNRVRAA
jgi:hypothetical protein